MAKVAFVLGDGFEDSELKVPYDRVREAGHDATIVGVEKGAEVTGKRGDVAVLVEATPADVRADEFSLLVIPGGWAPDKLRMDPDVVDFVRGFFDLAKPVAAICHAGSLLVEADAVRGRRLTSYPSIRTDLVNAGAEWVDEEVVEDGNLVTSRRPADLDAFTAAILRRL